MTPDARYHREFGAPQVREFRLVVRDPEVQVGRARHEQHPGDLKLRMLTDPEDPGGLLVTSRAMCTIRGVMVAMILLRPLLVPLSGLQTGRVMSMQPAPWPDPDPAVEAAVRGIYGSRKTERPLAVDIRDRLGEWLHDEDFAAAFGIRGRPGW